MSSSYFAADPRSSQISCTSVPASQASSNRSRKRQPGPSSSHQNLEPSRSTAPKKSASTAYQKSDSLIRNESRAIGKDSRRALTSTSMVHSPIWDRIGDDDGLYIQSDELHSESQVTRRSRRDSSHQSSAVNQSESVQRKRKRTSGQVTSSFPDSEPQKSTGNQQRSSSNHRLSGSDHAQIAQTLSSMRTKHHAGNNHTGRTSSAPRLKTPTLKYDSEGCANCKTNQSTCWWKKKKRIPNPDGTETCMDEKLCNPCSIHWNKNGYHRTVKPKATRPMEPLLSSNSSFACSRDVGLNCSGSATKLPIGLSSPTPSKMKPRPGSQSNALHARPPSQLTLVAEREAQLLKKGLYKGSRGKIQTRAVPNPFAADSISEDDEDEPLTGNVSPTISIPAPKPRKRSSVKARSLSKNSLSTRSGSSSRQVPASKVSSKLSVNLFEEHSGHKSRKTFSDDHGASPFRLVNKPCKPNASSSKSFRLSPPRTPPPSDNSRINLASGLSKGSSDQLCGLDSLLSPSFLDASPNSLLRKLNRENPGNQDNSADLSGLSASILSACPLSTSEKVFSPSRKQPSINFVLSRPTPVEPKKIEHSSTSSIIGQPKLSYRSDPHSSSKSSFFASSPSMSNSREGKGLCPSGTRSSNDLKRAINLETLYDNPNIRSDNRSSFDPLKSSGKGRAEGDIFCDETFHISKRQATMGSARKNSRATMPSQPVASSSRVFDNHLPQATWARRIGSRDMSSEDFRLDERIGLPSSSRSPLRSCASQNGSASLSPDLFVQDSGLAAAISRGLNPLLDTDSMSISNDNRVFSEPSLLPPSSPPILPPPSDCSEGITPLSGIPFSDGVDEPHEGMKGDSNPLSSNRPPLRNPQAFIGGSVSIDCQNVHAETLDRQNPLSDITPSINQRARSSQSMGLEIEGLSPEIISALTDAVKAGWSADELARALRNINSRSVAPTTIDNDSNFGQSFTTVESASHLSSMSFYPE